MRTKNKTLLSLAVMAIVTAALTAAPGGHWEGRGPWGREHPQFEHLRAEHLEKITRFLDLTDQQVAEWKTIHESRGSSMRAELEAIHELHEQVRELASAEQADAEAVGSLVIEIHRRLETAKRSRETLHQELADVLTPEQRERFAVMKELRGERGGRRPIGHGHRMHRMHRMFGGPPSEID